MSSIPPYNPRIGDRAVWLCPLAPGADLPDELDGAEAPWGAGVAGDDAAAAAVRRRLPGLDVQVRADPGGVAAPSDSWLLAAGHPAWCEVVLRRLLGMPPGTATFVLIPGALSVVQLLPDRAMLVRLNDGAALS